LFSIRTLSLVFYWKTFFVAGFTLEKKFSLSVIEFVRTYCATPRMEIFATCCSRKETFVDPSQAAIHSTSQAHYTLHITHYTLHIITLHITHYTLHITHYTLHITHYTLHITHYTLHITHYTLHITHYT
jgi:hypothetical protein